MQSNEAAPSCRTSHASRHLCDGLGGSEVICASEGDVGIEGAPILTDLPLVGQLEGDPWTIILSADFEDSDGNSGAGLRCLYELFLRWNVSSACTPSQ